MPTSTSGTSTAIIIPGSAIRSAIPFRYGDYSALKRNYLPDDYRSDSARFRIAKTVHMEAEWDRADPVAETRWIETVARDYGLPSACIGHAERVVPYRGGAGRARQEPADARHPP